MSVNLYKRNFLTLKDFTEDEILYLLSLAKDLKAKKKHGIFEKNLANMNIALIFEKNSTRTRCAFVVACNDEGACPEFLSKSDIHLGGKEDSKDTARVLGRMFDGIEFRGYSQETVEVLAKYSGVPVWNGLTDVDHPTQVLADFMTIQENFGKLKGINLTYVGDGRNNMSNALMIGSSKCGLNYKVISPKELFPEQALTDECGKWAKESGGSVTVTDDMADVKGSDVLYTDVWVSMGEEAQKAERYKLLTPYRVTSEAMKTAGSEVVFMHCLPAVKGDEVTEEVFESPASVVFDEAENRMHTIKAVMVATLSRNYSF
ncbi:MAG: ornithine carbamoyltransferase [Clostridiales bacterium]|nr:ornithine carbamoyltransferase [Clostridiales bacterium]